MKKEKASKMRKKCEKKKGTKKGFVKVHHHRKESCCSEQDCAHLRTMPE